MAAHQNLGVLAIVEVVLNVCAVPRFEDAGENDGERPGSSLS